MHREQTGPRASAVPGDKAAFGLGPLRNGNPRGDPNSAPRCGAHTRAGGSCQAPAMANGRCRMHGGASTGPRTEAGRARLRAVHTTHGGYGAENLAALRRTGDFVAETRRLLQLLRQGGVPDAMGRPIGRRKATPHTT